MIEKITHNDLILLRRSTTLNQSDVAKLSGISIATVGRIERGYDTQYSTVLKLIDFYNNYLSVFFKTNLESFKSKTSHLKLNWSNDRYINALFNIARGTIFINHENGTSCINLSKGVIMVDEATPEEGVNIKETFK